MEQRTKHFLDDLSSIACLRLSCFGVRGASQKSTVRAVAIRLSALLSSASGHLLPGHTASLFLLFFSH